MMSKQSGLDFSTVIASTVHDMKNSLAMLMQAHSQWQARLQDQQHHAPEQVVIEHEFAHLNGMLVQLLGLYKLGINQLPMLPDYHDLDDFIGGLLAGYEGILVSRDIVARFEIDQAAPLGFFDRELVGSVVSNIINNATRYAGHALLVTVREEGEMLVISINDDGTGFPAKMIEQQDQYVQGIEHSTASTGLGLYFAARIAALHERNGVQGRIEIANGGALGGGLFRMYLP
ncbi:sensor histidine kinase [Pseudomonas huaxiensis]|uniref:sensor histidine kinase n=1 Tax=Pseudomonas huaxiensis TaxID=2213017 RepID=UPI000DA6D9CA|nr:HAMP domain-containing sensor histidine kinase [Pseudomonas huaxiensis]